MASQRDMFFDSSQDSSPKVKSSLPSALTYEYLWVILFQWDVNVEKPFDIYPIGLFPISEIKEAWISGDLEELSRLKKLQFRALKGKTFSLFGKVEKCRFSIMILFVGQVETKYLNHNYKMFFINIYFLDMDAKRRSAIVEALNDKYSFYIKNFDVKQAYAKIVTWKPYKALSCFVYDWSFVPLKRGQLDIESPMSPKPKPLKKNTNSNIEDEKEFVHKSHRLFVKNVRMAQEKANEKKKSVQVLWRGYTSIVDPGPEISIDDLRGRLLFALRQIMAIHKLENLPKGEEKVI